MILEHAVLVNKTVLVEVRFGNRYHFRGVGIVRLRGDEGIELVMAGTFKAPSKELTVFPITAEQAKPFLPSTRGEYALVFDGVFCPTGWTHEAKVETEMQITSPWP
jgi:hypothetical protein